MQPRILPLSYGAKVKKLFSKSFYLNASDMSYLIYSLEREHYKGCGIRHAVSFIDENGEWLDG